METWDAIRARRNIRSFDYTPIDPGELDRILEAGRLTPSSSNQQRWDFVVVKDAQRLQALSGVWRGAGHVASSAATIALIAPRGGDQHTAESISYDLGQVTMSMMLAAADLGIGTGHSAVRDQDMARRLLGFPEDRVCAWLIALGHPADRPLTPIKKHNRRPFDEVVHRDRW